jgi:hypothetical protein
MKQGVNPAFATVAIVIVVAVAAFFIWKGMGPRSDGPSEPVNMAKMIGKDKIAPPPNTGRAPGMGPGANR